MERNSEMMDTREAAKWKERRWGWRTRMQISERRREREGNMKR
jgi:hypothetical protein